MIDGEWMCGCEERKRSGLRKQQNTGETLIVKNGCNLFHKDEPNPLTSTCKTFRGGTN